MDPTALGRYLRESRESKELTLEDAVRALRIRRDVLEAFERGEFDVADSPVRVRGMLRNYARYLGLEEDRVLQYYEAAHDKRRKKHFLQRESHIEPLAAPKSITDTPPALPVVKIQADNRGVFGAFLRNLAMILVSVAAIAVIGFVIFNMLDFGEEVLLEPTATLGTVTITPTNTPSLTPATPLASSTPDRLALGLVGIQVILEMQQRSWVRIQIDGQDIYTGILEPNTRQTYEGSSMVSIIAANAAALKITYNGVEQSSFGARGQQVELSFSPSGMESSLGTVPPTEMPINTPETTEEAALPENSTVAEIQVISSPTTFVAGVVSPTPLFPSSNNPESTVATSESSSVVQPTSTTSTINTVPTATIAQPSMTATTAAVLPLRATPADATATKAP